MDWATVTRAEIISTVAVAIACASAFYTWRNFRISARKERREVEATRPLVEHYFDHYDSMPQDFISLRIVVRNRSGHGFVVDGFESPEPNAALILDSNIRMPHFDSTADYDAAVRRNCAAKVQDGSYVAPGEVFTFKVHIFVRRPSPTLQLVVSLSERLAAIRRSAITVKIKLPDATIREIKAMTSDGVSGASQN